MSDPQTKSVEELQAEIDRLNTELAARNTTDTPQPDANPSDPVKQAEQAAEEQKGSGDPLATALQTDTPSTPAANGKTVIGAAPDPRGGYVIAYSDGTVTLDGVPQQQNAEGKEEDAQPWGDAPGGVTYTHFFVTENGDVYNFVTSNKTVTTVANPVRHLP